MKKTMKALNKHWRAISITVAAAGLLVYPLMRLVQFVAKKLKERNLKGEGHPLKAFSPAYRGRHKIHPRHLHNGHGNHSEG